MKCNSCGQAIPGGAKFCMGCGQKVVACCASCAKELLDDAKFCMDCGTAVAGVAPKKEEKPVSVYCAGTGKPITASTPHFKCLECEKLCLESQRFEDKPICQTCAYTSGMVQVVEKKRAEQATVEVERQASEAKARAEREAVQQAAIEKAEAEARAKAKDDRIAREKSEIKTTEDAAAKKKQERSERWRKRIEFREQHAITADAYIECARQWLNEVNDEHAARNSLNLAEMKAYRKSDWKKITEIWVEMDEKLKVSKILKQEDLSILLCQYKNGCGFLMPDWLYLFKVKCSVLLGDFDVEKKLEKLEVKARINKRLLYLEFAYLWLKHGNENRSFVYMNRAMELSESTGSWYSCANTGLKLQNEKFFLECINQAEKKASTCMEWMLCSKLRLKHGDIKSAVENMKHAAMVESVKSPGCLSNWCDYANSWLNIGDERSARRCMNCAEKIAGDYSSYWCECARSWVNLGDDRSARRCMNNAEKLAKSNYLNWFECASSWMILGDINSASHCMNRAKGFVKSSGGWQKCAMQWLEIGEKNSALSCIKRAEELAENTWEVSECASFWLVLGDKESAHRCLKRGEEIALNPINGEQEYQDWIPFLNLWMEYGDEKALLRCIEIETNLRSQCIT